MGLAVHALSAKTTIGALGVILVLVHVVRIIGAVEVRMRVRVAAIMSRLGMRLRYVLSLRSRASGLLTADCRVGCGVATVLSIVVSALTLE
jgi:hypothetical protein